MKEGEVVIDVKGGNRILMSKSRCLQDFLFLKMKLGRFLCLCSREMLPHLALVSCFMMLRLT